MKAVLFWGTLAFQCLLPVRGYSQEAAPQFKHYMVATCLGNVSGIILTGAVLANVGAFKDDEWSRLAWALVVGPTVGCNLGALAVSRERGWVFRSNLLFTALPWVLLLNETTNALGLYSIVFALPLIIMTNAYHIDHEAWREAKSFQSVSGVVAWLCRVPPVEPVRFVAKVPVIQVSW